MVVVQWPWGFQNTFILELLGFDCHSFSHTDRKSCDLQVVKCLMEGVPTCRALFRSSTKFLSRLPNSFFLGKGKSTPQLWNYKWEGVSEIWFLVVRKIISFQECEQELELGGGQHSMHYVASNVAKLCC